MARCHPLMWSHTHRQQLSGEERTAQGHEERCSDGGNASFSSRNMLYALCNAQHKSSQGSEEMPNAKHYHAHK